MDLDREQDCYDFLMMWATPGGPSDYYYFPYSTDAFEFVEFLSKNLSFSHLVAFTLLKLRLGTDLERFDDPAKKYDYFHGDPDSRFDRRRYVDSLAGQMIVDDDSMGISQKHQELTSQYLTLMQWVHDANPYFWPAFLDIDIDKPERAQTERAQPRNFRSLKEEEAAEVPRQGKSAWLHSSVICTAKPIVSRLFVKNGSQLEKRRGVGKVLPSRFQTPQYTSDPATLFHGVHLSSHHVHRFVQNGNHSIALAYVDGACSNNGMQNPKAGWAVVYGPGNALTVSGRLEMKGPFGEPSVATSNRAELRASIAALRLTHWRKEGFDTLVIATDSTYVVDGATQWIKSWLRKEWRKSSGERVKNRDLWEILLGEVERWHDQGLKVELWRIPRELNTKADKAAKEAANESTINSEFQDPAV
ncbi:hypothetical protein KJ359_008837 [Pestalotiopsis sp. 9143b]|nr:hypothetical protein KJ359_008837 [Pestalotiopsis sp. 9143b]